MGNSTSVDNMARRNIGSFEVGLCSVGVAGERKCQTQSCLAEPAEKSASASTANWSSLPEGIAHRCVKSGVVLTKRTSRETTGGSAEQCDSKCHWTSFNAAAKRRPVFGSSGSERPLGRARAALPYMGCAVNLTPSARATFITVSKRGFAPGASAL